MIKEGCVSSTHIDLKTKPNETNAHNLQRSRNLSSPTKNRVFRSNQRHYLFISISSTFEKTNSKNYYQMKKQKDLHPGLFLLILAVILFLTDKLEKL
jgi:hypothetical protein